MGMTTMAWSLTHAKLHTLLRSQFLLPHDSHILMAISGGQDSLCLARLLIDISYKWRWSLSLVHCDHRWRNDSAENADYVIDLAKKWSVPAYIEVADAPPKNEADARKWRYGAIAKIARQQNCTYVVTGHTASDRAETVLYNLIRGTGIDGISALPWQRLLDENQPAITLVRPLLNFSRQETGEFCQQHGIKVWEDSSNANLKFRRNRIRLELLPYLREHFNPQVERSLSQTAEITGADAAYLQVQANNLYKQVVTEKTHHTIADQPTWEIQIRPLSLSHQSLQRRVIRQLLQRALPQPPTFQQIESLANLISAPNGSQTGTYPGQLIAQVRKPIIWFGMFS